MSITAKDIAKALGLSAAAVSLALNNKAGVSSETKRLIYAKAEELGYDFTKIKVPNGSSQTALIQFIIYKRHGTVVADTPFFTELTQGISIACKRHRYQLSISYLYEDQNIEQSLNKILQIGCKGIIILGTELSGERYEIFENLKTPVLLLDTYFEGSSLNSVLINNVQGAYLATSHLIKKYKCQPAYLRSSYPINNFNERADGFYKAVRECGMSTSKSIVHHLSPTLDGSYNDMNELLDSGEKPERCYFADNDIIACGAIKSICEHGYTIPDDVAIVGFDDIPMCAYMSPPLTTLNVPKEYMGDVAVERLSQLIDNPNQPSTKIEVATKLVKRRSV